MSWGRKILKHIFPIVRLVTIFIVALFLPRFFIQTFKKEKKPVDKKPIIQVASHTDLDVKHTDKDKKKEKNLLLKKKHALS